MRGHRWVQGWLVAGAVLIAVMVVVGGVTRLTGSGLSITEWRPVTGAIPPLTEQQWEAQFALYRATPQFKLLNSHFTLSDFRRIFFWEYLHRLLGRVLGLWFIVPLPWFFLRQAMDVWLWRRVLLLIALGGLQGLLGWLMVASGLVEVPAVSHYRLAAHLLTALFTYSLTLWTVLEVRAGRRDFRPLRLRWSRVFLMGAVVLALLAVQLAYGALTAGSRAGYIFSTFPTMNGEWMPEVVFSTAPLWRDAVDNPATVQFIHRWLGLAVAALGMLWVAMGARRRLPPRPLGALALALLLQYGLGVLTVLQLVHRPVWWGTVHQAGAMLLLSTLLLALFAARQAEPNPRGG